MVATNLPFEAWPEVCGSEWLTGAVLDRLTHRVHILEANGESYRLRGLQATAEGPEGLGERNVPPTRLCHTLTPTRICHTR